MQQCSREASIIGQLVQQQDPTHGPKIIKVFQYCVPANGPASKKRCWRAKSLYGKRFTAMDIPSLLIMMH